MDGLPLENKGGDNGEHGERNHLLDDFQLHQVEGAATFDEADAVGWNHEAVFKQSNTP